MLLLQSSLLTHEHFIMLISCSVTNTSSIIMIIVCSRWQTSYIIITNIIATTICTTLYSWDLRVALCVSYVVQHIGIIKHTIFQWDK